MDPDHQPSGAPPVPMWARIALGLGTGVVGSAFVAGLGLFCMMMAAFSFDSPHREMDSETVMIFIFGGLGVLALACWVGGLAWVVPGGTPRKVSIGGAVLLVLLGFAGVAIGMGLALFGG